MNKIYVSDNYIVVDIDGKLSMFPKNRSEYDESVDSFTLRKYPNKQVQIFSFKDVGDWFDIDGVVPFTVELLRTFLRQNTGFNTASGGSGAANVPITQSVDGYSNFADGTEIGQIGYSKISEGTRWLPGTIGGTYYPAGFYVWDGNGWVSDRNAIAEQLQNNLIDIQSNDNEILSLQGSTPSNTIVVKQASQLQNIDSSKLYLIDGKINMGTQQIEVPSGGFYYRGQDYFVSCLFSNEDNYTMFVNASGQAAGNVRGFNVEHYVSGTNSQLLNLDNQNNFGSIEFISCNLGSFSAQTTSLGSLSNYRQFRTDDLAFIRIADGIEFNGTWFGGFAITGTLLLSIPANTILFKEGTSLDFQGSSISDMNALSVNDTVTVFDFQDSNFSNDEGFKLDGARFKIGTIPIPNMSIATTKKLFKDCRAIKNTFPGARWEVTTQTLTPLTQGVQVKANGTTTYDDEVHFSNSANNAFTYDSTIEKDFIITGQLVVDGGANDEIDVIIRKWNNVLSSYEEVRTFTRNISNVVGGLDIAYFDPYAPVTLNQNDRIEVWLRNNTDGTDATLLSGSFLAINVRN